MCRISDGHIHRGRHDDAFTQSPPDGPQTDDNSRPYVNIGHALPAFSAKSPSHCGVNTYTKGCRENATDQGFHYSPSKIAVSALVFPLAVFDIPHALSPKFAPICSWLDSASSAVIKGICRTTSVVYACNSSSLSIGRT